MALMQRLRRASLWRLLACLLLPLLALVTGLELWMTRHDALEAANAAYDRSLLGALKSIEGIARPPAPDNPQPLDADSASPRAAWAYRVRNGLTDNTESAVRAAYFYEGFNPYLANKSPFPPKMLFAIGKGGRTPFDKVRAPAIFILATADSIHHQPERLQEWASADPANRSALQRWLDVTSATRRAERSYVSNALKGSKVVLIPGARHAIFFSHPDLVEQTMKQFMTGLTRN